MDELDNPLFRIVYFKLTQDYMINVYNNIISSNFSDQCPVWFARYRQFGLLSLDSLVFKVQTVWFASFRQFGLSGLDILVCQVYTVWIAKFRQFGFSGLDSLVCQV